MIRLAAFLLTGILLGGAIAAGSWHGIPLIQPVAAQSPGPAATPAPPEEPGSETIRDVTAPETPPHAARGRIIFSQNCAPCHGDTGLGDGPVAADLPAPPPSLADPAHVQSQTPAGWFTVTKYGRIEQMMPPWESRLSDQEIWQAVFYAWSLHLDQAALDAVAPEYAATCAGCHGPAGAGDGPSAGDGELPSFADSAYTIHQSNDTWLAAWDAIHPELGTDWPDATRRALLEHMRTFSYVPAWDPILAGGSGVIQGEMRMGTPGSTLPAALDVRLETYLDFEQVDTQAQTITDGSFRFENLTLDPQLAYLVVTEYAGVQYSTPILTLSEAAPTATGEIMLYEETNDPSGLFIDRVNWIIEPQPDGLLVGQIVSFGLTGDRTYVGSALAGVPVPVTVGLHVPSGAQEVRLENGILGGRYHQQGELIYDTVPIAPGAATHQLVVRYFMPSMSTPLLLSNEFIYPINALTLLVADLPEVQVEVPGLTAAGTQDFQGTPFRMWQDTELAPGSILVRFSGLNIAAPSTGRVALLPTGVFFGMGGMVGVLLLAAVAFVWRRGALQVEYSTAQLHAQRTQLLADIARLDDLQAAGALDEHTWQQRRAQLKVQALTIDARLQAAQSPAGMAAVQE